MSTPEELYVIAAHYLKVMTDALSESARLHKAGELSYALERVSAWIRRYRKATDAERTSIAMFNDWYENVVKPSDVYSEWLWQITTPQRVAGETLNTFMENVFQDLYRDYVEIAKAKLGERFNDVADRYCYQLAFVDTQDVCESIGQSYIDSIQETL